MNLDEAQRKKVGEWISQGLKLSEIQNRLLSELGLKLTYMDVRLLVDDLKLTPKDPETKSVPAAASTLNSAPAASARGRTAPGTAPAAAGGQGVKLNVDQVTRPGAVVSGTVTFSDGNKAGWYLDQSGQLGLVPEVANYRPPQTDVQQFQIALDEELSKLGF
jgi:hypothetical protein